MRKNPILVANAFIWAGEKILLLKRSPKRTFGHKSPWNCPGGAIEFGEDPRHAMIREVREETGIELNEIELVTMWADTFPTGIQIIVYSFLAMAPTREVRINEESVGSKWFTVKQALELETFPNFKEGLLKSLEFKRVKERLTRV